MRNGFLAAITALLACSGLSLAQMLPPAGPATAGPPDIPEAAPHLPASAPGLGAGSALGAGLPTPPADGSQIPVAAPSPGFATPVSVLAANAGPAAGDLSACPQEPYYRPDCPGIEPAVPPKDEPEEPYHFWVSAEYMLWRIKDGPMPTPLATTGPAATFAVLNTPGTTVGVGDTPVNFSNFNSGRWTLGFGGPCELLGVETTGFFLEKRSAELGRVASDATGTPVISRPVISPTTGAETPFLVAFPGAFSGSLTASASSRMWGAEINSMGSLYRSLRFNADMLLGFRYLDLEEDLDIVQNTTLLTSGVAGLNGTPLPAGADLVITDRFSAHNHIYGGQLGVQGEMRIGKVFFVYGQAKVALGTNHEILNVNGNTAQTSPVAPMTTVPGGLLAVASNIGSHSEDVFAVVPEGNINIGCQITKHLFASVGYTFLYANDVIRPGEQISRVINQGLVPSSNFFGTPGPAQPSVSFHHNDFWAQGVSAGLSIRY